MALSVDQELATEQFLNFLIDQDSKELTMTAPPGRGKTFVTKHLIQKAHDIQHMLNHLGFSKGKLNIRVTATTNTAAEVASKMLGQPVVTIHSLLGLTPKLNRKTWKEELVKTKRFKILSPMVIIIDEGGSVNPQLMAYIREACVHCKVFIVGDDAQTAPVGEDFCPYFDDGLANITLTTNHRNQGAIGDLGDEMRKAVYTTGEVIKREREIVAMVQDGIAIPQEMRQALSDAKEAVYFPPIIPNGVDIIEVDGEEFQEMVDDDYTVTGHKETDGKIICWRNVTVADYNDHVRGLFTDDDILMVGETVLTNKPITSQGMTVASTDSLVMVTGVHEESMERGISGNWLNINSSYDVFQAHDMNEVRAYINQAYKMRDYEEYNIAKSVFVDLRPTHSCTVHKAQGKTYKTVYLNLDDIDDCPQANAVARMLNTGITRASERLVVYGSLSKKYGGTA